MTMKTLIIFGALTIFFSCSGQGQKTTNKQIETSSSWLIGDTVYRIDGEIRGIIQDSKNNFWFASNGNGVYKYNGKIIINYTEKHGLSSNYVWMAKEGKDGKIWFKTNVRSKDVDAICSFDGYAFKTVQPDTSFVKYNFKKGDLIFDYYLDGKILSKIQLPHTSPIKNEENKRHHYDIFTTYIDKSGNVWFGTCTAGICKYDGENYTWFDNKELGSATRDINEDRNGRLWTGNNGDGLFRYDGKNFVNFSREKNLHNPDFEKYPIGKPGLMSRVWKITDDNQGNLWVATIDNGVWSISDNSVINYTTKDGLPMDNIWTVYTDKQGKLWVGTEGDGVYTFDGKKFNRFKL